MKRAVLLLLTILLTATLAACGSSSSVVSSVKLENGLRSLHITIDPGHGGIDNGAVGTDTGVLESTLNLEIAQLVAKRFMLDGSDVLLTRTSADVDYTGQGNTQKRRDMNNRAELVKAQAPQLLVSIHMNKYPDRKVNGAQVFFEKGSAEGEKLATCIQESINSGISGMKQRVAKSGDYFMLKVTDSPSVIVECGFLSNRDDEKKLCDPAYRAKLAECIYNGICSYLDVK